MLGALSVDYCEPQGMEIHLVLRPALPLELTATAIVCSSVRGLGSKKVKLISGKLSDSRVTSE